MIILTIIASMIDALSLYLFSNNILYGRKKEFTLRTELMVYILFEVVLIFNPFSVHFNYVIISTLKTLYNLLAIFMVTMLYKGGLKLKLFVGISFATYSGISEECAAPLFEIISKGNTEKTSDGITLLLAKTTLFFLVILTVIFFNQKNRHMLKGYKISVFIPPILSLFILVLTPSEILNSMSPNLLCLLLLLILLFANILNYIMISNISQKAYLSTKVKNLDYQLAMQEKNYNQLQAAYRSTRRIVHDTKKHMMTINGYVEKGEYYKLSSYTKQAIGELTSNYIAINTGNLVIDTFINSYAQLTRENNIYFNIEIDVNAEDVPLADYDFSIILGNLLENCYNAAASLEWDGNKYIDVMLKTDKNHFIIQTKNPCKNGEKAKSGSLLHGYGIANIKKIVHSYSGSCDFSANDEYIARIVIPIYRTENGSKVPYYVKTDRTVKTIDRKDE